MSWHTGSISAATGALIGVLDAVLVLNSHWSIFDAAAGTNAKVYKCEDADDDTLFYLYVDDNVSTDYGRVKLYETWDADAHTGTGGTGFASWRHKNGTYNISLDDTQVIYIDTDGTQAQGGLAARVKVVDPTIPQVVALMGDVTTWTQYLAFTGGDPAYVVKVLLRGPTGVSTEVFHWVGLTYSGGWYGDTTRYSLDVNGHAWFNKGWIYRGSRLLGFIEGVIPLGSTATYGHGDIISIGGEDWVVLKGNTNGYALIKK